MDQVAIYSDTDKRTNTKKPFTEDELRRIAELKKYRGEE